MGIFFVVVTIVNLAVVERRRLPDPGAAGFAVAGHRDRRRGFAVLAVLSTMPSRGFQVPLAAGVISFSLAWSFFAS